MKRAIQITMGLALLSLPFAAEAQKPIVYPAKGQSAAQQSKDDAECYAWAKQNCKKVYLSIGSNRQEAEQRRDVS